MAKDLETASVAVTAVAAALREVVDEGFQDMEAKLADVPFGEARVPISSWTSSQSQYHCHFCGRYCGNLSRVDFHERRWT